MKQTGTKSLTRTQRWVLDFLKAEDENNPGAWVSPTTIGSYYGIYAYNKGFSKTPWAAFHSSWASPRCLQLTELGLIERNEQGHYRYRRHDENNREIQE